jgi:hypothetical protein
LFEVLPRHFVAPIHREGNFQNSFLEVIDERQRTKQERETIIGFNEEEETASIWTASETVYRRLLKRLGRAYLSEDSERHAVFIFPAEFLALPRAKAKKVLTPEQKAQLAHRLAGSPEIMGGNEQNGHGLRGS